MWYLSFWVYPCLLNIVISSYIHSFLQMAYLHSFCWLFNTFGCFLRISHMNIESTLLSPLSLSATPCICLHLKKIMILIYDCYMYIHTHTHAHNLQNLLSPFSSAWTYTYTCTVKKAITRGWGRRGPGWERGGRQEKGEPNQVWGGGRERRAWRIDGNKQPQGWEVERTLWKTPEAWKVRNSQNSNGGMLGEIPNSGERELIQSPPVERRGIK